MMNAELYIPAWLRKVNRKETLSQQITSLYENKTECISCFFLSIKDKDVCSFYKVERPGALVVTEKRGL
jgi:hypothetical protein